MVMLLYLPSELLDMIFELVDDIETLAAAHLACRGLHSYLKNRPNILHEILERQINPALLPNAFRLVYARHIGLLLRNSRDESDPVLIDLIYKTVYNPKTSDHRERLKSLEFEDIKYIAQVSRVVQDFALDYSNEAWALVQSDLKREKIERVQLSQTEHLRICRTFYLMQMLGMLLYRGGSQHYLRSNEIVPALTKLSSWELHQLVSVMEYLWRRIRRGMCLFPYTLFLFFFLRDCLDLRREYGVKHEDVNARS